MKWNCGVKVYLSVLIIDYQKKNMGCRPRAIYLHPDTIIQLINEIRQFWNPTMEMDPAHGAMHGLRFMNVLILETNAKKPYYNDHLGRKCEI